LIHRVEEEPALARVALELVTVLGLVPGDVEGDARSHSHQTVDDIAIVELLVDIAGLAGPREAGEARAPGSDSPGGDGDAEADRSFGQPLDVDPSPAELPSEVDVVLLEGREPGSVLLGDELVGNGEAHRSPSGSQVTDDRRLTGRGNEPFGSGGSLRAHESRDLVGRALPG
jgi:hypothetical protein